MKALMRSRKGSDCLSVLLVIIVLFALAITIPLGNLILTEISDQFTAMNASDPSGGISEAANILAQRESSYVALWDGLFLTIVVMTYMGTIISCWFIRSHPVFFIVGMFIQMIFMIVSLVFGEALSELYSTPTFLNIIVNYPILSHITANFPFYMFVFNMLVGIALYAKSGGTGQEI